MEKESNKMTAVQWLIKDLGGYFPHGVGGIELMVKKALQMEKQQMIDFADNYVDNCVLPNENMAIPTIMDVPNYYNEQYGGNK